MKQKLRSLCVSLFFLSLMSMAGFAQSYKVIIVPSPGELGNMLNFSGWSKLDSIVVKGAINEADIKTLVKCSLFGSLRIINLEETNIVENILPGYAFMDLDLNIPSKLDQIILPNNITEIGTSAFKQASIDKINIPDQVTTIRSEAFSSCSKLNYVNFPKQLKTIEHDAFNSTRITEIVFPATLEFVGKKSFDNSRLLEKVYCPVQTPPGVEFDDPLENGGSNNACPFVSDREMTLYVPKGTGDLYRNADGWKAFDNIVETDNFPSSCGVTFAPDYFITASDGMIRLTNLPEMPVDVTVYGIGGNLVRQQKAEAYLNIPVSPGFYLVKAGDRCHKVSVR